jgi:hypothetical protein
LGGAARPGSACHRGRVGLCGAAERVASRQPLRRAPPLHRSRSPAAVRSTPRWRGSTKLQPHMHRVVGLLRPAPRPMSPTTASLLHPFPPPLSLSLPSSCLYCVEGASPGGAPPSLELFLMAVTASGGRQRGARETSCRRRIEGMVDGGMGLATHERGRRRVQRKREGGWSNKCGERGF